MATAKGEDRMNIWVFSCDTWGGNLTLQESWKHLEYLGTI